MDDPESDDPILDHFAIESSALEWSQPLNYPVTVVTGNLPAVTRYHCYPNVANQPPNRICIFPAKRHISESITQKLAQKYPPNQYF